MRFRHLSHLPSSGSTNRMVKTDKVCRSEKVSWCQSESNSEYALIVSSSRSERCLVSVFYHLLLDGSTTPDLTNTCPPQKKKQTTPFFHSTKKHIDSAAPPSLASAQFWESFQKLIEATIKMTFANGHWNPQIDPPKSEVGTPMVEGFYFFFGGRKKYVVFFKRRRASFVGIITNPSYQFIRFYKAMYRGGYNSGYN